MSGQGLGSYGGGGGGGWFGGGGGGSAFADQTSGGGGGGSSYVDGLTGVIVNTQGLSTALGNGAITISYNVSPNAPTPTYPSSGATIDHTVEQTFLWPFSDDDAGDVQSAFDLRWRVGSGAWNLISDVAQVTTVDNQQGSNTFTAGTFSPYVGQSVEWQVRTYDSHNAQSPWSASNFFTPTDPPAGSFVFDPAPTSITSTGQAVQGERSDGGPIAQYRARATTADGATVLADTGVVTPGGGPVTSISATLPTYAYVNGTSYRLQTQIAYPAGVWQHGWTDTGPLVANIQPPAMPLVELYFDPITGSVDVEWANPTPTDPALTAVSVDITRAEGTGDPVRIATGLPVNSAWTDYLPAGSTAGLEVDYRVIAYTATGASASSA